MAVPPPICLDQLAERDAERRFEQPAVLDVAGQLNRRRAARAAHAVVGVGLGAFAEDERHRGQAQDVVDDGGPAEEAVVRRQRRLRAHDAALALQAFEQRRFLAAHIRAGAHADLEIECVSRAGDGRSRAARLAARSRSRVLSVAIACGYSDRT